MSRFQFSLAIPLLLGSLSMVSCGQEQSLAPQPVVAAEKSVADQIKAYAQRPELQDADSQTILREHANDPLMLDSLKRAYGEGDASVPDDELAAQKVTGSGLSAQATGKAGYAQSVAWGTYSHFVQERRSPNYSGLVWWGYDGCSAPRGFGLGYRDTFRPACDVHDFGYRNLPHLISVVYWPYNRARTDFAFLRNMQSICAGKSWTARPGCYAAAQAYYTVVDEMGFLKWHR